MLLAAEANVRQAANYQILDLGLQPPTMCFAGVRASQVVVCSGWLLLLVAGRGTLLAGRLGELLFGGYMSFLGGKWKINRPATDVRLVEG